MMRLWMWMAALMLSVSLAQADEGPWKLVWQDDFERAELGDGWYARHAGTGVRIVDGRLFMGSGAPVLLVNRPFAADVKIEFEAEADPNTPPCDLSVAMAGSNLKGYGHLLAFGGRSNQANQIVGGGAHAVDHNPPFVIEHGRTYKLVAVKEGPWLRYFVDGTRILETQVKEPLGGPGFDRVGLVTWHGMYVDNVKVYERTTPAPGGPVYLNAMPDAGLRWASRRLSSVQAPSGALAEGIEAYNARQYDKAIARLAGISPPTLQSVAALGYVLGDLAWEVRPEDRARLLELARSVAEQSPDDPRSRDFLLAAEWFSRVRIYPRDSIACTRLIQPGAENNPFYYKARLFTARYHHASAVEGGDSKRVAEAREMFAELKELWPEHPGLRGFTGERIPWGDELILEASAGPAWARHLQEALARQQAILDWWFTERQFPDGQLGGGWGDDVELLRTWVPAACISTACETAIAGIERLADGVWNHVLVDGYDPDMGDVEHSAEPSADTLPTMILLRYGDPLWVERNLRSAKTIRERMMGINDRGFLHFKSTHIGAAGAIENERGGGDTGYHARAMKHFIWLAWYGIPEARDVFSQWCDGWRDVTMRQIGNKPPGFPPASVWFPSGEIAPPSGRPWYDELSNSYGFPGLPGMIHDSFLTAFYLSGERRFLDPVQTMMDLATLGPLRTYDAQLPPDDTNNLLAAIAHHPSSDITSVYRWLTGERVYDEYTLRGCTATQRYMIDYDLDRYAESFEGQARRLRDNWVMWTSEVLQTDRAALGGAIEVCGAYTGAVCSFRDSRAPTLAVTYDTPDLQFASLVTESTAERLRVRMYSFHDAPIEVGLRPWRLVPGTYVLNTGEPVPGEAAVQSRYTWTGTHEIEHRHRGTPIRIPLPPGKEWVVDLRLRGALERPALLPDLALAARDVKVDGSRVIVTVHNLGAAPAGGFDVVVEQDRGDGWWVPAGKAHVEGLPAIRGFEPVRQDVTIELQAAAPGTGRLRITLDPAGRVEESYELNNVVSVERAR